MQTIYYTTPNFIHHTGNVVDLAQYRRKLALEQLPSQPVPEPQPQQSAQSVQPTRPSARGALCSPLLWDGLASAGVLVMTLSFAVRVLAG